mmetsp:Transcript_48163/g.73324  ORF Transcript_48163/g.73324 Transcript_48163/m.73324 type:complete len:248 (-) Transcript_48163:16-759(-)
MRLRPNTRIRHHLSFLSTMATSLTNAQTSSSKRRVRFFEHVVVCPTRSFYDYSQREIQACWYAPEERKQIRQEASKAIRSLARHERQRREKHANTKHNDKSNKNNDDAMISHTNICTRGLEHMTKPANRWRKHIRRTAADAVFDEMDRQMENIMMHQDTNNCTLDHERIATIYSELTKGSRLEGYVVGLADYKAAYPEIKKDTKTKQQENVLKKFFKAKSEDHPRLLRPLLSATSRRNNGYRISVTV